MNGGKNSHFIRRALAWELLSGLAVAADRLEALATRQGRQGDRRGADATYGERRAVLWYYGAFEGSQATPGKLALGIRVETVGGKRMTPWRALARAGGKLLSGLIFGFGYWLMLIVPEKNTLHDQLTKTTVVLGRRPER